MLDDCIYTNQKSDWCLGHSLVDKEIWLLTLGSPPKFKPTGSGWWKSLKIMSLTDMPDGQVAVSGRLSKTF